MILEASCESCFMTFVFVVVVVLKESVPHLDLFDGILYNLLKEKWKHACRYRFVTKDNVNMYIRQCKRERELEIIQH